MEHLMNLRKKLNINRGKPLMNASNKKKRKKRKKEKERKEEWKKKEREKIDIIVSYFFRILPLCIWTRVQSVSYRKTDFSNVLNISLFRNSFPFVENHKANTSSKRTAPFPFRVN